MKIALIIIAVVIGLLLISQLYLKMAQTETQPYKVIKTEDDFEIRQYPPAIMATISMDVKTYKELSTNGFKKLASYIFGGNQDKKSIAMTSPVHMDINDSSSSMSFVMPANYNIDNLPKPDDASVKLETTTQEYVAVVEFGGYANDDDIRKYASKLEKSLKKNGIQYYGNFRFLGYNAPFQLLGRKNEIIVTIYYNEKK